MEKNRLLDFSHKTVALIFVVAVLSSCSLPHIAVIHDPLTPEEHLTLGLSYEKNRELDAALKEYQAAVFKLPIAYLYIGNVHFQKDDFEKAENSYKKAIEKTKSPYAYNNLAWLYYSTNGNMKEAENLARKALELSPEADNFKDTLAKIQERRTEQAPPTR
jgi:tetratricopeptide (TPR) repeat protein